MDTLGLLDLRDRLHRSPPPWFEQVRTSGIGWKVTDGRFTAERALVLLVDAKLGARELGSRRIPEHVEGWPTDVLPAGGDVRSEAVHAWRPSAQGRGVLGRTGEHEVTVSVYGTAAWGRSVGITAASGLTEGSDLIGPDGQALGRCVHRVDTLPAGRPGEGLLDADLAVLELPPGTQGSPDLLLPEVPGQDLALLREHPRAPLVAFGAASGRWRASRGVRMIAPWRRCDDRRGHLLLETSAPCLPGDAGAAWLLPLTDGALLIVGMHTRTHHGLSWVTDTPSLLAWEGVRTGGTWSPG